MDAPKRIGLMSGLLGWRLWNRDEDGEDTTGAAEYILATEHARIVAEKDARIARLREACNQSRLAFAGYVSAQSAIDALDRAALKGDDNG